MTAWGGGVAHIPRRAWVYPIRRSVALRRSPTPVRSFYDGVCLVLLIVRVLDAGSILYVLHWLALVSCLLGR